MPNLISPMSSPQWNSLQDEELATRHSKSLLNRTPPPGSLSAELLTPSQPIGHSMFKPQPKNKVLISNIRDISETLSDFISNRSSLSLSDESDYETTSLSQQGFRNNKSGIPRKRKKSSEIKVVPNKSNRKVSPDKESEKID